MSAYRQLYLFRRVLRLAGQPDTATDYYSDYAIPGPAVTCIVYEVNLHSTELLPGGAMLGYSNDHPSRQFLVFPETYDPH